VKPLQYRELVWDISLDRTGEALVLTQYQSEEELAAGARAEGLTRGQAIDLSGQLGRSDLSSPKWSRHQVSANEAGTVGRQLWSSLPEDSKAALGQVSAAGAPLRLKITTEIPAVADLPWEWLSQEGQPYFALSPTLRLVRSVPVRLPVSPLSVELPLNVLLVVPNPKDERFLNAGYEIQALKDGLPPPQYNVTVLDQPSFEDLQRALRTAAPHIVHYIGHGGLTHGEGNLILQDADGRSRWVSASELADVLPSSVRLLCLSTPFTTQNYQVLGLSHFARAIGLVTLPTTLTNQYPIGEPAVRTFWGHFYSELIGRAGNVNDAVHEARVATEQADLASADWGSFSLVVRDQTGVFFDLGYSRADPLRRRGTEVAAQYAAQLANELATQVQAWGPDVPKDLAEQFQVEQSRASDLLHELNEEA
jgi:hypothetical protein